MQLSSIPQIYRNVGRWTQNLTVLSRYGLADWISQFDLDFAKGILTNPDGEALARQSREVRIRNALTDLGPTFEMAPRRQAMRAAPTWMVPVCCGNKVSCAVGAVTPPKMLYQGSLELRLSAGA